MPPLSAHPQILEDPNVQRKPSLLSLSDDILFYIANYVVAFTHKPEGRESVPQPTYHEPQYLLNLALCSRRLHMISEPVLYTHLHAYEEGNQEQHFLRRILARPDLAKHVKILYVFGLSECLHRRTLDMSALTPTDRGRVLVAAMNALGIRDEAKEWARDIRRGNWDAVVGLLLSLLPNLQELEIAGWWGENDECPHIMQQLSRVEQFQWRSEELPYAMSPLRSIAIEYYQWLDGISPKSLAPFLIIPGVKTFYCRVLADDDDAVEEDESSNVKYNTTHLTLHDCNIAQGALFSFLRYFPFLRRLYFKQRTWTDIGWNPCTFMSSIEHLSAVLEELTLMKYYKWEWDLPNGGTVFKLASFERLRKLTINLDVLIGASWGTNCAQYDAAAWQECLVKSLPNSLQELTLLECTAVAFDLRIPLLQLLAQKSTQFPHLRTITLNQSTESSKSNVLIFSNSEKAELWARCEQENVSLTITVEDFFEDGYRPVSVEGEWFWGGPGHESAFRITEDEDETAPEEEDSQMVDIENYNRQRREEEVTTVDIAQPGEPIQEPAAASIPTNPHSKVESLDDDVLRLIIEMVGYFESKVENNNMPVETQCLKNITLCSRRLHAIAEPVLYSHFQQRRYLVVTGNETALASFLCTLLRKPSLALGVKQFHGHLAGKNLNGLKVDVSGITAEDWDRINEAGISCATRIGYNTSSWRTVMSCGNVDAFMTLILFLATNLQELVLTNWTGFPNSGPEYFRRLFELAKATVKHFSADPTVENLPLQKLHTLRLDGYALSYFHGGEQAIPLNSILPFFELPSLRKFSFTAGKVSWEAYHDYDLLKEDEYSQFAGRSFNMTDLTISRSVIECSDLPSFFQCFPKLEHLSYLQDETSDTPFSLRLFNESIAHLKKSLTSLSLDCKYSTYAEMDGPYRISLGPFNEFHKLLHLRTKANLLFPWFDEDKRQMTTTEWKDFLVSRLPTDLEILDLMECYGMDHDSLREVDDERWDTFVPIKEFLVQMPFTGSKLKELILCGQEEKYSGPTFPSREEFQNFLKICREMGVKIDLSEKDEDWALGDGTFRLLEDGTFEVENNVEQAEETEEVEEDDDDEEVTESGITKSTLLRFFEGVHEYGE